MAYGGRAIGGGEGEISNPVISLTIPREVEDIDFAIDYYESDKDFLKIANTKFPDGNTKKTKFRELVSYNYFFIHCILYVVYFHHHYDSVNPFRYVSQQETFLQIFIIFICLSLQLNQLACQNNVKL